MRTSIAVLIGFSCSFALFACSGSNDKPHLVSYSEVQKQQAPIFAGAIDQVRSFPITGNVGGNLGSGQDGFVNDGKPFNGLKVIIQGGAFSNGFLGAPKPCLVDIRKQAGDDITHKGSASFTETGTGVYTAIVPITCDGMASLDWSAPCLKVGDSNYEVIVGPEDGSAPSVTFKHSAVIMAKIEPLKLDEQAAGPNNANSSNATTPADSTPKTQYELQQKQEQERQEEAKEDAAIKDTN